MPAGMRKLALLGSQRFLMGRIAMDPGAFKHPDVVVWGLRMESVHKGMGKWEFLQLSVLQVHVRSHLQVPQAVEPSELVALVAGTRRPSSGSGVAHRTFSRSSVTSQLTTGTSMSASL